MGPSVSRSSWCVQRALYCCAFACLSNVHNIYLVNHAPTLVQVNLRRLYPDRVFLLVGHRDANKLRFLSELTGTFHDHTCTCIHLSAISFILYLVTEAELAVFPELPQGFSGNTKYREFVCARASRRAAHHMLTCATRSFLQKLAVESGLAPATSVTTDVLMQLNTLPNRLRWILDCTMDAVGDFEHRRKVQAFCGASYNVCSLSVVTGTCATGEQRCFEGD